MDQDPDLARELAAVHGEVLATQALLIAVVGGLVESRPELAPVVCGAFDRAERMLDAVALRLGDSAPAESTIGALRILEQLRAAAMGPGADCGPSAA